MDPVSALGLASSIITFIDFAWGLVSGAVKIYRSPDGTICDDPSLEQVLTDLESVAASLQSRISAGTRSERNIKILADECIEDVKRLGKLLAETRISGSKTFLKSLNASWSRLRYKGDVANLKDRIDNRRSEIILNLSVLLVDKQSSVYAQLQSIERETRMFETRVVKELASTRTELVDMATKFKTQMALDLSCIAGELLNSADRHERRLEESQIMFPEIKRLVQSLAERAKTISVVHRILGHLVFPELSHRRQQIRAADKGTFSWMIENSGPPGTDLDNVPVSYVLQHRNRTQARLKFLHWLEGRQNLLHITGRAGSGKSTLLKFLAQHRKTKKRLTQWAGTKELIISEFYFWRSGADLQASLPGLYRTILIRILSCCPELSQEIFPLQFQRLLEGHQNPSFVSTEYFDDAAIEKAFHGLLQRKAFDKYRFCFFIDALDENAADVFKHESFAVELKSWTESEDIKICLTSRPYKEDLDVFQHSPNSLINLHELNGFDIHQHCLNRIHNDLVARESGDLYNSLVNTISEEAGGVFLWAHLVLDIVLRGIRAGHSLKVLERKVQKIPPGLESIYDELRATCLEDDDDERIANRIILLAIHHPWQRPLNAMDLFWVNDNGEPSLEDADFPDPDDYQPYPESEIERRLNLVAKQVDRLTRGFLEMNEWHHDDGYSFQIPGDYSEQNATFWDRRRRKAQVGTSLDWSFIQASFRRYVIRFSHKTARDYFFRKDRLQLLNSSFPNFNIDDVYGRLCVAEVLGRWNNRKKICYGLEHWMKEYEWELLSMTTIRRLGLFLENVKPWGLMVDYRNDGGLASSRVPFSLAHFAASVGLDDMCLRMLSELPQLRAVHNNTTIVMSALEGHNLPLARHLLDTVSLDDTCCIEYENETIGSPLPLWAYLSLHIVHKGLKNIGRNYQALHLLVRLKQHGMATGVPISLTITWTDYSRRMHIRLENVDIWRMAEVVRSRWKMGKRANTWRREAWEGDSTTVVKVNGDGNIAYVCSSDGARTVSGQVKLIGWESGRQEHEPARISAISFIDSALDRPCRLTISQVQYKGQRQIVRGGYFRVY